MIATLTAVAYLLVGTVVVAASRSWGLNRNARVALCVEPVFSREMQRQRAAGRRWMWTAVGAWIAMGVVVVAAAADTVRVQDVVTLGLAAAATAASAWMVSVSWQRRDQLGKVLLLVLTGTGVMGVVVATVAAAGVVTT